VLLQGVTLRGISNETRLKNQARVRIEEGLKKLGLIALPEVPDWQEDYVYITRFGSDVHKLYNAVNEPSEANLDRIHGAVSGSSVVVQEQNKLKEVLELVNELHEVVSDLAPGED